MRASHSELRLIFEGDFSVWKNIPNDEHWLTFNIEMLTVEPWSLDLQFNFLDINNDTLITENEVQLNLYY